MHAFNFGEFVLYLTAFGASYVIVDCEVVLLFFACVVSCDWFMALCVPFRWVILLGTQ